MSHIIVIIGYHMPIHVILCFIIGCHLPEHIYK